MAKVEHEIIVIGAGAAGLMAARELSRAKFKVIVLEARDRIGGRIWTENESLAKTQSQQSHPPIPLLPQERDLRFAAKRGNWMELGAEFIHGEAETTFKLLREYGISYSPAKGEFLRVGTSQAKDLRLQNVWLAKKLSGLKR